MVIKNIRLIYPGVSKQKAWEGFKAVINRKGLCNGSSTAYGVYNFEGDMVNSSRVYKFPAEILKYIW